MAKIITINENTFQSENGLYQITKRIAKRGMEIVSVKAQNGLQATIKKANGYTVTSNTLPAMPKYVQEFALRA